MKLSSITALASCAVLALSQPLEKRVLVVETVYEQVVETVDVTTTRWVTPGELSAATVTPKINAVYKSKIKHKHHTRRRSAKPKPVETSSPVVVPVDIPEATSAPVVESPPLSEEQGGYSYSIDPQTEKPSATLEADPAYSYSIDAQIPSPTQTPKEAPPQEAPPPKETSPQEAPPPKETPPQEAPPSSGGDCGTVGGQCSGDLTFYEAGLGACGDTNNGETDDVFALAHEMMGTQSNGNPFCGRSATVTANGKSVVVKLADKCMGCVGQSIDLSYHAIDQIMDRNVGRMSDVKWTFND